MKSIVRHKWLTASVGILAVVLIAALLFRWDWLIPFVDRWASATLGRPVTITHLHVDLGRTTRIEADDVVIANPEGWPGGGTFATIDRLDVYVVTLDYILHHQLVLPVTKFQSPKVDAQQLADGRANWHLGSSDSSTSNSDGGLKLGKLQIDDGHVHVRDEKLRSDFNVDVATKDAPDGTSQGGSSQIVADARGTYAKQPITAQFVGGALLSLRDDSAPYPVDLKVANGPTRVSLKGTVQDPLHFAGANLTLELSGPDMSLLLPLTGIAIPKTPPYHVAGKLSYSDEVVKFQQFTGKVGSSDLAGNIEVDTKPERPVLTADLQSRLVNLKDLGGFIGAEPGDSDKDTKKATVNTGKVLPNEPLSLPKLNVADVHLKYRAGRIEGRRQPLDNMRVDLDIVNGNVHLHPLSFGIGQGQITSDLTLVEVGNQLNAKTTIDFQRIPVDKLLNATGVARGAGVIGGRAVIDGTGRSVAEILGRGNGELKLYMGHGGNLSALLVDLSGLEFGNALLSAIGVPSRATLDCLITDLVLQQGIATARTVLIDTDEARIGVTGDINLRSEGLALVIKTESKHFSIGSLPTPIDINGTLGKPGISPEIGPLVARAGAAVALGILATPLAALLPTIQFGTGEDHACAGLLRSIQTPPRAAPARQVRTRR